VKLDHEEMRIDTCYHEATHAVFYYHASFTIRRVYVTERLNAECVCAVPVEPYPYQALALASGLIAAEYAVYRRLGREVRPAPFEKFTNEAEVVLEMRQYGEPEGEGDEGYALEMLRIMAESGWYGEIEDCYRLACDTAILNLGLWWPEIVAVAERLREEGRLDGEECVGLIESADYGEE
jgi:hypothetical protein